jgi:hypothetical protein
MYPDEVYDLLVNAGFLVSLAGMAFVVSLVRRAISISEVQAVIGDDPSINYRRRGDGSIVVYWR